MSYNIIVAMANGEGTVTVSGDVPDGNHIIHGHTDLAGETIGVSRSGTNGVTIAQVSATVNKGV